MRKRPFTRRGWDRLALAALAWFAGPGRADVPAGSVSLGEGVSLPPLIAHRGASYDAPENTLASFALAWEQGADGFECDVWQTADGEVVCLHDADTGRVGDGGGAKGSGRAVQSSTLAELREVEVGSWKAAAFAGERLPTLSSALALVPTGKRVYVEIKSEEGSGVAAVPAIVAVIDASGLLAEQMTVISFDAGVVAAVKSARPGWTVNWLTSFKRAGGVGGWRPTVEEVLATLEQSGADGLGCKAELAVVDGPFVARLRDAGFGLHLWTINDAQVARRAAELGVDSITTDRPGYLRAALTAAE